MNKPLQTLSQAINGRVSEKLVSDVNVNEDKYIDVSFKLAEGKYAGCHVSAIVSLGDFDPYYVEIEVSDANLKPILNKAQGCDCVCNLQDQLVEFLESDLEFDTDSKAYYDFETDISFSPKSYEELENVSDEEFEATAFYDGVGIMVKECDLILIERSLLDAPEHNAGCWPANVKTYRYDKGFDQEKYIAAFWGRAVDNYILLSEL
ncbi:hypothetical protein [Vibrio vulnificus]|uniref:Uncharacterized protein n=1 Tax=Vibrio vulnificus TaxID=672 RepID=A0A2S3R229_VIBVL|nr:hypothetical protein [Vibrio vulnificus]POB47153.1 hypothetical protein CRN52_13825 [Vibrio vulnificus]